MSATSNIVPIGGSLVVGRDGEGHGVNLFRHRAGDGYADAVHVVRIVVDEEGKRHCYIVPQVPADEDALRAILGALGLDAGALRFTACQPDDDERDYLEWLVYGFATEGCA